MKAEATVSSTCWAAAIRSRITFPDSLGTSATTGRCPYFRRSSWTAAAMSASVFSASVVVSPVVSRFPDGVRARAKCPDGRTVTGIRHRNFALWQCAESAFITRPNSRSISRPSKMGVTSLGTMCEAKRSSLNHLELTPALHLKGNLHVHRIFEIFLDW